MAEQVVYEGRYDINGLVLTSTLQPPGTLERMRRLHIYQEDIFVTGYPKSGSVWVYLTLTAIRKAKDLKQLKEEGVRADHSTWIDSSLNLDKMEQVPRPTVFRTHMKYEMFPTGALLKNCKIVHIIRNPKDVAVSYFHMHRMRPELGNFRGTWDTFFEAFKTGNVVYGNYFDWVEDWLKQRHNPNVMFIKYGDYVAHPKETIITLADFIGEELTDEQIDVIEEVTSFPSLKSNAGYLPFLKTSDGDASKFFRKGVVGDWANYFSDEQAAVLDEQCKQFEKKNGFSLM